MKNGEKTKDIVKAKMMEEFLFASHLSSDECAQRITEILKKHLPIVGATFFSYYKKTKMLTLRAQKGFNYNDYDSFQLSDDKFPGQSIEQGKHICKTKKELFGDKRFRNKKILSNYEFDRFIVFPIPIDKGDKIVSSIVNQEYLGAVCIYPSSKEELNSKLIKKLQKLLGKVFTFSIHTDRTKLRRDIVDKTLASRDVNSFLHKTVDMLKENWGFEASSIFLLDKRNNSLYMRATTGVKDSRRRRLVERNYQLEEEERNTVKCFNEDRIITIINPDSDNPKGKYKEITLKRKISELYVPIYDESINLEKKEVIGVIRTINKIVKRGKKNECCIHGWVDAVNLDFVAEIIGVIVSVFKKSDRISQNFSRSIHGLRVAINSALIRLNDFNSKNRFQLSLQNQNNTFLGNSIAFL